MIFLTQGGILTLKKLVFKRKAVKKYKRLRNLVEAKSKITYLQKYISLGLMVEISPLMISNKTRETFIDYLKVRH